MKLSDIVHPGEEATEVGRAFETPLVVYGNTWLPITQLGAWLALTWYAGEKRPQRSWPGNALMGAVSMPVVLGSEWCHNLAHAAAANYIGKPMDAIRINWGMPLCVYHDINDPDVTPRQHITRALGGPIFNALVLPIAALFRWNTPRGSITREIADITIGTNLFLLTVALLPIPGIDGGPILKWSLVEQGYTPEQADQAVRKVDGVLGVILGILSLLSFRFGKRLLGAFLGLLGLASLGVASGLLEEQ